jgi:hypothetical protein
MAKKISPIVQSSTAQELIAVSDSTQSAHPTAAVELPTNSERAAATPSLAAEHVVQHIEETTTPDSSLSAAERKKLARCEAKIAAGLQTFYDLGLAIREVRDARLYRESYSSIEEYGEQGL